MNSARGFRVELRAAREIAEASGCIAGDRAHGDGIDRVMARDHQTPLAIAHDQVAGFTDNAVAELLKDP